jgi:hypothetical protein
MLGPSQISKVQAHRGTLRRFVDPASEERRPCRINLWHMETTRAAAYVFLPSITAIKFLANLDDGR